MVGYQACRTGLIQPQSAAAGSIVHTRRPSAGEAGGIVSIVINIILNATGVVNFNQQMQGFGK